MPSSSILLSNRSNELNCRSARLRVESARLNDQSMALRKKACALSIQEATRLAEQSPAKPASALLHTPIKQEVLHSWKVVASFIGFGGRSDCPFGASQATQKVASWHSHKNSTGGCKPPETQPIGWTKWERAMTEMKELPAEVARL